jgi:hypothetical protein
VVGGVLQVAGAGITATGTTIVWVSCKCKWLYLHIFLIIHNKELYHVCLFFCLLYSLFLRQSLLSFFLLSCELIYWIQFL